MFHLGIAPAACVFAISLVSSYALTPVAAALARRRGWMDLPQGVLKVHSTPVPRAGGLAMWLILSLSLPAVLASAGKLHEHAVGALALLTAATFALIAGAIDDAYGASPSKRLLIETAGAVLAVSLGIKITLFGIAALDAAVSVCLLVGLANAFNLTDGIDGLATGLGCIASAHLALLAATVGDALGVMAGVILVGCCLGFIKHNLSDNRKVFLGDGGSLFLGMTLSALAIRIGISGGPSGGGDFTSILIPFLALAVPGLETSSTVARRLLAGRPLFAGDRSHVYDALIRRGLSPRSTLFLFLAAGTVLGASAVALWGSWPHVLFAAIAPIAAVTLVWQLSKSNLGLPSQSRRST